MHFLYERSVTSELENKEWKNAVSHISATPRRTRATLFELDKGHDSLPYYRLRFGVLQNPNCFI